ncbi:MAG: hypothetical protein KJO36_00405 [Acidimicrobiia bacterium]|nr:hypothetical protein [Acidimicrobiia bacterium]
MAIEQYKWVPRLDPVAPGADVRIQFSVKNSYDGAWRDYTSATVSVLFTPERGDAFTKSGALNTDAATGPQCYVDVADTDTSSLDPDQDMTGEATVTLSGGSKDKLLFIVPLLG